jgi:NTE family protein
MKIGLVLSGGGARGFAHLGVIKGLLEQGFEPQKISGVSSGAIVGALFSEGYSPDQIMEIFLATKLYKFIRPAISWKGFFKLERLEKLYEIYLPHNSFERLKIPFTLCATDLQAGKTIYFSHGPLIQPLLASGCIPVMFEPVTIDGQLLVDGGILNNLPVEPLLGQCDFIIGVHTNPHNTEQAPTTMRTVMERSLLLAIQNSIHERAKQCDFLIEPPLLSRFTTMDRAKAKEIFEIGYSYTMQIGSKLAEAYAVKAGLHKQQADKKNT